MVAKHGLVAATVCTNFMTTFQTATILLIKLLNYGKFGSIPLTKTNLECHEHMFRRTTTLPLITNQFRTKILIGYHLLSKLPRKFSLGHSFQIVGISNKIEFKQKTKLAIIPVFWSESLFK